MPQPLPSDFLLKATQILLTALLGMALLAGAIVTLCIPIILSAPPTLIQRLNETGIDAAQLPSVALLMVLLVVVIVLVFFFLRELRRIVATVSGGDPFVPANADRLRRMAWLALAMQVIMIPLMGLIVWFDALPQKANVHYVDNNWFGGILLALVLLILARVFRRGTEMREELEGTV